MVIYFNVQFCISFFDFVVELLILNDANEVV